MLLCVGHAAAAEDGQAGTIRFRRILAPEDRIQDWPLGDGKYLPVDAAEFDRLVAKMQLRAAGAPVVPAAAITSARYVAKLVDDHLVGQASAEVVLTGPGPAMLPWEPCNLALGSAAWAAAEPRPSPFGRGGRGEGGTTAIDLQESNSNVARNSRELTAPGTAPETETQDSRTFRGLLAPGYFNIDLPTLPQREREPEAVIGLGGDGKLAALVERSGRLQFDWSLAGRRESADVLSFRFEVPSTSSVELSIELPKGFTPAVNRGLTVTSEPVDEAATRWHIALGGRRRFRLRVLPADAAARRPQLALLRESRTYDFSLRGVEVLAQWRLRAHNQPLQRLSVVLDPGLHLISARSGETAVPWSAAPAPSGQATRFVLTLPEPIGDAERVVRLTAWSPLTVDRPWRLPRIRAERLFWQEGSITLLTPEPLVAVRVAPLGCAQTGAGPLSAPRTGESLQFQAFEPDATIELSLLRRPAIIKAITATSIELGSEEAAARVAAECRVDEGTRFAIEADVAPRWVIDAVESTPPDAVADWTLEPRPDHGQRLTVRLDAALSPIRPLRLSITARRPLSHPLQTLGVKDLSPVRLVGVADSRCLIAVRPAAPYTLKISGARRLTRLRPEGLSQTELGLLAEPPRDLLFECDSRAGPLKVSLTTQEPRQIGAIQTAAGRVSIQDGQGTNLASATECRLESWYQGNGTSRHQATYRLQDSGPGRLRLTLPRGVARQDIRRVSIDGNTAAWQWASKGEEGCLTVDLPTDRRLPSVMIQWMASGSPLRTVGSLAPSLPEPDLPVLASRWTARLPPGYDCVGFGDGATYGVEQGWTVRNADLAPATAGSLRYVHGASIRLFGTIALLVALCLTWRWIRPRPAAIPDASRRQDARAGGGPEPAPDSTVSRTAQLGLLLLGILLAPSANGTVLGEPLPERPAAASPLYRVLVPIDAEKKPTGGKVYVPEPFYQELYRRASPLDASQGWLIHRATYRGVLAEEPASGRLAVDTLRVQYDLRVFGRGTRVRIPLHVEDDDRLPSDVLLDGRAIELQWEHDAGDKMERFGSRQVPEGPVRQRAPAALAAPSLAFEVAEPGEYRLEMSLRLMAHKGRDSAVGSAGFDVSIPRVAQSRLELTLPRSAPLVEAPSARGAVRIEKTPPRLVADLGPADRLTVRWREWTASSKAGPAIDVEQFVWMKLRPGSVVLDAKFKLRAAESGIQQVQLAVDPRLRLLPLEGDDPPAVQVGPESDQSRLLSFRWSRPVTGDVTLEATFLLNGATGVGNFRLPRIELLDLRLAKRWMAVGVDPALDGEQQKTGPLESVAVSDFLAAWGAADARPLAAYRLPAGEIDWAISTRPHEPRTAARQTLTLAYDEDRVDLLLEAKIETSSGYVFQHQIDAPASLKVENVSLLEGDVERAGRWSRDADGAITVFLNAAASGEQKLTLRGQLPVTPGKAEPLPKVRLQRCELRAATVRLYRRPPVALSIHGVRQPIAKPPDDTLKPELGRWVEAFSRNPSQPITATVTIGSEK